VKLPITLADAGEDRVVAEIIARLHAGRGVVVGAGDDCAVLRAGAGHYQLFKTDVVVESVHFLPDSPPARVGWKAACRALSDIAAMGGWPTYALVTLIVPAERPLQWVRRLYSGLNRAARCHAFSIVGGETSRFDAGGPAAISISMLGRVEKKRCLLRSGARPGDLLFVTGQLGGSLAGWHLKFQPRIAEARWLARRFRPSAMIDLSDGLGSDLPRLAAASGVGFEIDLHTLPRRRGASIDQALSDGEDYELLFTVPPKNAASLPAAWQKAFPRLRLTRIGRIVTKHQAAGAASGMISGWDHFKPPG
jgi:thiamine-monophosphate kinase